MTTAVTVPSGSRTTTTDDVGYRDHSVADLSILPGDTAIRPVDPRTGLSLGDRTRERANVICRRDTNELRKKPERRFLTREENAALKVGGCLFDVDLREVKLTRAQKSKLQKNRRLNGKKRPS